MNEVEVSKMDQSALSAISVATGRATRRTTAYLVTLMVTAGVVSLVLLSPLIFRQFGHIKGINWAELSNVGQTYGAASAILSAIALLGVSLSLLVQARQARTERVRITRERHMELLQIILEDPGTYYPVTAGEQHSTIDTKQLMFSNILISYARVGFVTGVLSKEDVRADILQPAFAGEPMKKWWAGARKGLDGRIVEDRRERRFIQLVDEEYLKAVSVRPPSIAPDAEGGDSPDVAMAKSETSKRFTFLNGTLLAFAIGFALGSRRWFKRR